MNLKKQHVMVFQRNGSGLKKVSAIETHAAGLIDLEIVSIDDPLPVIIDDAAGYLPERIEADLVLDFVTHPDVSADLGRICSLRGIPVVASGRRHRIEGVATPPT